MIPAVVERCAGIDVSKKEVVVTILKGPLDQEPERETRTFGTVLTELQKLRAWLMAEGVSCAVMESTGIYWQPIKTVLEDATAIVIANAEDVKLRAGHKTDPEDSWWLAHLLRHAMIRGSFLPPRLIEELRDLTRRRKKLLGAANSERNRIQKLLERASVKMGNVMSDAFGISGQRILQALLDKAPLTPAEMAELAKGRLRAKLPELTASLEGHRLTDHDRWMIRQSVEHLKFLEQQMSDIGQELLLKLQPFAEEFQLLQTIPGVKEDTAAVILAETGGDMSQFATPKDLTSWAGLSPGNHVSAGKRKNRARKRGNRWLRGALAQSAQAAARKRDSILKARFYRWQKRIGKPKALVALSRNLLTLVWHILTTRMPYTEADPELRRKQQREDQIQHHIRRLRQLGIQVPEPHSASAPPSPTPLRRKRSRSPGPLGFHAR